MKAEMWGSAWHAWQTRPNDTVSHPSSTDSLLSTCLEDDDLENMPPAAYGQAFPSEGHGTPYDMTMKEIAPPSTLAAQLVQNYRSSSSSRSSRPDEMSEIKTFVPIIEKVKNRPDLLKTLEQKVEHNHMLIYVVRVVLEGDKWDDPLADRDSLHREALKVINCLKATIEETPAVLRYAPPPGTFISRGSEELWLWLFPKLLRIMGHPKCLELLPHVQEFFRSILASAYQSALMWDWAQKFNRYLREIFDMTLTQVKSQSRSVQGSEDRIEIELPPSTLVAVLVDSEHSTPASVSYTIRTVTHAMNHANAILSMLICLLEPGTHLLRSCPLTWDYIPWLLEALPSYHVVGELVGAKPAEDGMFVIRHLLSLLESMTQTPDVQPDILEKGYSQLVLDCARLVNCVLSTASNEPGSLPTVSRVLGRAFLSLVQPAQGDIGGHIHALFQSQVVTLFNNVSEDKSVADLGNDFWISYKILKLTCQAAPIGTYPESLHFDRVVSADLRAQARQLGLQYENPPAEPQAKRRKIVQSRALKMVTKVSLPLFQVLGCKAESSTLLNMKDLVLEKFRHIDDDQRCIILNCLGSLCCATDAYGYQTLENQPSSITSLDCLVCLLVNPEESLECQHSQLKTMILELLSGLIEHPAFNESRKPRVVAMMVLRKVILHSEDVAFLDLETSTLGQWCLKSLHSSVRELRVAASRSLSSFVIQTPRIQHEVVRKNKENILSILRELSASSNTRLAETCILAWGHVGKFVVDEELNLVLAQFLEYMADDNPLISSLAFNEVIPHPRLFYVLPSPQLTSHLALTLTTYRGVNIQTLFEPFWKSLAFSVVKKLPDKPQVVERVAKLLGQSVDQFLIATQRYSLPWLFLTKRVDVITRIIQASHGASKSIAEVFTDPNNLAPILALLLVQDSPDMEQNVMGILRATSPEFEVTDLVDFLKAEPIHLPLELFYLASDGDEHRKRQVRSALEFLATKLGTGLKQTKKHNIVGKHLREYILGLLTVFAAAINDAYMVTSINGKKRAIRALEELVKMCKSYSRIARPHIATCLLACFNHPALQTTAFSCWSALIIYMDEEDVEVLLETTFFIIIHFWSSFEEVPKAQSRELLSFLADQHSRLIQRATGKIPSLASVPELADFDKHFIGNRPTLDPKTAFTLFAERIRHENSGVVMLALRELSQYLGKHQAFVQMSAINQQPDEVIGVLMRSLLDCSAKYNESQWTFISRLCNQCLGLVGCIDSNRVEALRHEQDFVVVTNFNDSAESTDFVIMMFESVLIKSFVSTQDTRMQSLLSWAMQEMLDKCDFRTAFADPSQEGADKVFEKWNAMSDTSREILTPFLSSTYILNPVAPPPATYPLFQRCETYYQWLSAFVSDLLGRPQTFHSSLLFPLLQRVSRDTSVSEFLLPYLVAHIILGEPDGGSMSAVLINELRDVIEYELVANASYSVREDMKLFYNAVFRIFDYSMRWLQKRNAYVKQKLPPDLTNIIHNGGQKLESMLEQLDKATLSRRATDCGDFPRALFSLELYVTQEHDKQISQAGFVENKIHPDVLDGLLEVYTNIDDPDGLDGISSRFPTIDINQQILSHRKAGRWTAAQSWYEIKLAENPDNLDRQLDLLSCLKESGQYDILLNHVEGMKTNPKTKSALAPFALEAFWATGRWASLDEFLGTIEQSQVFEDFNCGVAEILRRLRTANPDAFAEGIQLMRDRLAGAMTFSVASSLRSAHDFMLKCHVLTELEMIGGSKWTSDIERSNLMTALERRLEVLGAYVGDKQYLLGVRRAAMDITGDFSNREVSSAWLASAKLARKSGAIAQAFSAVLHASQLGDGSSTLENAKLLWKEGHNRKAIQVLEGAVVSNALTAKELPAQSIAASKQPGSLASNLITAKAHLLLAKWLGASGQAHFTAQREKYVLANKFYPTWEKGHYYLGRHYKKLLEAEEALKSEDQSDQYVTGQVARLVIENYVRALGFGTKYLYQTLPRVLTLWLDLGANISKGRDGKPTSSLELREKRRRNLDILHDFIDRKIKVLPVFVWYTVIFQIVARIAHQNEHVFNRLQTIIYKVVQAYPRQAIWSVFPLITGRLHGDRKIRGDSILKKLRSGQSSNDGIDMRNFIRMGEKLGNQLLMACHNGDFPQNKTTRASITRDLGFNHKCTPCPLVVPVEIALSARLPMVTESFKGHRPFSGEVVTIESFRDDVLVLGSLAKPRRVTCVGSDGKQYYLMLKPSDDLRTDQRLMEFNGIVNRALKRDAESSKRQLYVKTYAVTPLNEECGIIEWVDGLKTLRDILLNLYRSRGIQPNYQLIAQQMKQATQEGQEYIWTDDVLRKFPPVLQHWFVGQFPSPSLWFAARLRYTRSAAVMSMLGTILGLGDRHGENVLLEEGNGGVFHVDFNCLFDKGQTFACPEKVPFRLTHNMVNAMGVQGYEGAFRSCSELTLSILRQQEETLMSILEAFIYDPTLDLQRDKKKKGSGVKLNPHSVVESIKRKIRGLMSEETIPLGVEGQAEELIKQAVSHKNLAGMYIGWCPFL
ncbi:uncharacterized protein MKZ38_010119 [Zalerion maritima]|uniref:non-specific serine/threonine protein kinase n=1 Tax=Zalerion maritima TaxID=339359 RepID=A0AAD5WT50_9PEZI|nr:uncharacterized protein MKZ38_010119 [Zalerion maritima]